MSKSSSNLGSENKKKRKDEISKTTQLGQNLNTVITDYFQRIIREKQQTHDAAYKASLDQAKIAGQVLQEQMLRFQMVIENFNREDNANLKFLDHLNEQEQLAFIKHHLKIMKDLYAECEKLLNNLLSFEFFQNILKSLYPGKESFSNHEMGVAYQHLATNLNKTVPIIEKMIKALNDPSNVNKLKSFEEALAQQSEYKTHAAEKLAENARIRMQEIERKKAIKAAQRELGWWIFGIVSSIIAFTIIMAVMIVFAPHVIAGMIGFLLTLGLIGGMVGFGTGIEFNLAQQRQIKSQSTQPAAKSIDNEFIFKFSDKMRFFIQKIRSQFTKPDHSTIRKYGTTQGKKAFFEKKPGHHRTVDEEVRPDDDKPSQPKKPGGSMPEY